MAKIIAVESCFPDETHGLSNAIDAANRVKALNNPYTGNKKKLLIDIWKILVEKQVPVKSIVDLFSGSASFSIFFKLLGSSVVSNDLLCLPFFTSMAFVQNNRPLFKQSLWNELIKYDDRGPGFISNKYANIETDLCRFTKEEGLILDSFYRNIQKDRIALLPLLMQPLYDDPDWQRDIYYYSSYFVILLNHIMTHCHLGGRLNHGQVLADVNFRLERKNKGTGELNGMCFENVFVPEMKFGETSPCYSVQGDAIQFLNKGKFNNYDTIYIDPPYGGSQSDYAAMYRFCEEFIWQMDLESIPYIENNKRFSKSQGYSEQFEHLLSCLPSGPCWVISYNDSSWSNIDEIMKHVTKFRPNAKVNMIDYEYQYRKQEKSTGTEYLIIA